MKYDPSLEHAWKQAVTNDFLRGESVADISQRRACHKARIERVLREALGGLARLNEALMQPPPAEAVEAMQSEIDLVESK